MLSEDSFSISPGSLAKSCVKPDPHDHIHTGAVLVCILHWKNIPWSVMQWFSLWLRDMH